MEWKEDAGTNNADGSILRSAPAGHTTWPTATRLASDTIALASDRRRSEVSTVAVVAAAAMDGRR